MAKYTEDAGKLLDLVGGKENISAVTHCMTRMRFVLVDEGKADVKAIEDLPSAKGTFTQAGQFQVIIGNDVADFYQEFTKVSGIEGVSKEAAKAAAGANQNPAQRIMGVLGEIFAPIIPALICGGLVLGFRNIIGEVNFFDANGAFDLEHGTQSIADMWTFWVGMYNFLWVIGDMVLCHTSVEHAWFQRALAGDERYQRFYILRDGRGSAGPGDPGEPPTNWQCAFGGSAWQWEPRLGKWYLHMHDVSQPDLDWTNPEVRDALVDVVRFWRDRGVAGFRFDVVNLISKPEVFEDAPGGNGRRVVADGPHVHEYLQELVERAGIGDMLTVGEMASTMLEDCVRYTAPASRELNMVFNFHHLKVDYRGGNKWELMDPDIARLREVFQTWGEGMQAGGGWNALFWNNHDQPRAISRFGGRGGAGYEGSSWEKVGKMLGICAHFMQGTPYIYQGEEIGMTNPGYASIEDYRDVESKNYYRIMLDEGKSPAEALRIVGERSRDDGRTPMQWSADEHAGFTTGEPWIGVAPNYERVNVAAEEGAPGSMLEFYRELVRLRKELSVVSEGSVRFHDAGAGSGRVIAYERELSGEVADAARAAGEPVRAVVLCSFDAEPCEAVLRSPDGAAVELAGLGRVLGNYHDAPAVGAAGAVELRPFEAVVLVQR